jgi:phosphopantetheinyl transferase
MDAAEDRFLDDHALGSQVSDVDPALKPLPVVPFTVCLEMMTEVASLLAPGQVPTGIRGAQARQWIEVATPVTLEITARRGGTGDGMRVEVRNLGADGGTATNGAAPVVAEATVLFGSAYSAPPAAAPLTLRAERPPRYTAPEMYRERLMFHGPCFQGVASLDRVAENGVVGHLKVLPRTGLFASAAHPPFLLDPALLDATGQLIGYWAAEYLTSGYIVFPIRLGTLEVYGGCLPEAEVLRCEVEIHEVTTRRLRASMTLLRADGRVWCRLSDWEDWRFYWPRELYDHHRAPKTCLATQAWEPPVSGWPPAPGVVAQRLEAGPEITGTIAARLFVYAYLSGAERREWAALKGPEKRRTEWVLGRAAAKDAVRRLLKARYDVDVFPADIEIGHDEDGRPVASAPHLGGSMEYPAVSVSHSEAWIVALAGYTGRNLGIDLEPVRPREESFLRIAFDEPELAPLASLAPPERDEWITRLWCAKEAVAKAVGTGLVGGPRAVTVTAIDPPTGNVEIVLGPGLAERVPELAGAAILARTGRQGDHALAVCLGESRP